MLNQNKEIIFSCQVDFWQFYIKHMKLPFRELMQTE